MTDDAPTPSEPDLSRLLSTHRLNEIAAEEGQAVATYYTALTNAGMDPDNATMLAEAWFRERLTHLYTDEDDA